MLAQRTQTPLLSSIVSSGHMHVPPIKDEPSKKALDPVALPAALVDVRGLGVDAPSDAREERDAASAEAEGAEVPHARVQAVKPVLPVDGPARGSWGGEEMGGSPACFSIFGFDRTTSESLVSVLDWCAHLLR